MGLLFVLHLAVAFAEQPEEEASASEPEPTALSASVGGGAVAHVPLTVGANARGYLNIGEHLCFGPEVMALAPFDEEGERHVAVEASIVGHYIVPVVHPVALYPLVGVGVDAVWVDGEGPELLARGRFGGGVHLELDGWSPFVEYQLSAPGDLEQAVVLGALLHLGRDH